jgi:outer membrane protein assembly factor BamA
MHLDVKAIRSDFSRIDYYGEGARSSRHGRTTYRLETTSIDGGVGVRPSRHTELGAGAGYLWFNVGPGTASDRPSADQVFTPANTPGIQQQSNFFLGRLFAQLDTRDDPIDPRRGTRARGAVSLYSDRRRSAYSFTRVDAELEHYLSFFSGLRGIALHGRAHLTDPLAGDSVPFYLQPTLGGADDLRGYPAFRFYANDMFVFNAEYRWILFKDLSAAAFADMGKVLPRISAWRESPWRTSCGAGIRLNAHPMFLRLDIGFSSEGVQTWLKFENIFSLF